MPIRFRCVYCNQLLGISRRKAGNIVRCTKCEGQLIVPEAAAAVVETKGANGEAVPMKTDPGEMGGVFERDDFDALLQPYQAPPAKSVVADAPPPPSAPPPIIVNRPAPPSPAPLMASSVTLSRKQLTIASVLVVLAAGFAFACGLWVGLAMK